MSDYVDLHCHSTASDGTLSPAELAQHAQRSGLSGFALTDHDTAGGLLEAAAEAQRIGIDFITGIEISCAYPHPGTLHLLGYCVDPNSPVLQSLSRKLLDARNTRNPRIIQRLNQLGVSITLEEVEAQAGGEVVGRPHIAAVLVRKGYASSVKHAFDQYLGQGGSAYFDKERLSPRQGMDLVLCSGGIPVLAHPIQLCTENDAQLERLVKDLLDLGLAGIEVMHCDHTPELVETYTRMADRYHLLKTGGSDFHGANKKDSELGLAKGQRIPRVFFDALLEHRQRHAAPAGGGAIHA